MRPWNDHPEPKAGLVYTAKIGVNNIARLVALCEAYEGLATVRTKDASLGIVEFWISPLMRKDFESFLEAAQRDMGLVWSGPQEIVVSELEKYGRRSGSTN